MAAPGALVAGIRPVSEGGVVVEAVESGSFGERAGLRPGDVLESWYRGASLPINPVPAGGGIDSPFDWEATLREEAPRGELTVLGKRGGEARSWTFVAGAAAEQAGVRCRPFFGDDVLRLYDQGSPEVVHGDTAAGVALWRSAAEAAFAAGARREGYWLLAEVARALARVRQREAADDAYGSTVEALERGGEDLAAAELAGEWGCELDRRGLWGRALAAYERARVALERRPAAVLARAHLLHDRGEVQRRRGDYPAARASQREAFALRSAAAPESLDTAESLFALARIASESGTADASPPLRAALLLVGRIDPESLLQARLLEYQGYLFSDAGDLDDAERTVRQALAIARRREPGGYVTGRSLSHLARLLYLREDFAAAEELLRQALALWRALPDDYLFRFNLAGTLSQLGLLRSAQGDNEDAYDCAREAVAIQRRLNPRSLGLAEALDTLGSVARILGRAAEAKRVLQEAVALHRELTPESASFARSLVLLGRVGAENGIDLASSERVLRQALALLRARFPGGRADAEALLALGLAVGGRGRMAEALTLAGEAYAIRSRLTPGGLGAAAAAWILGRLEREVGRLAAAREHACAAAEILDRQGELLAGEEETRARLSASFSQIYVDCVAARLEEGRREEAWRMVEAGRARALLDLLATRDREPQDLPPELRAERLAVRRDYAALTRALTAAAAAGAAEDDAVATLRRRLADNRHRREDLVRRIRDADSRYAAFRYPRPLALDVFRATLEPGTLLLEFAVGGRRSYLFAVGATGDPGPRLAAFVLPCGEAALRREVQTFRRLAADPRSDPRQPDRAGRALYRRLLAPAERRLRSASRLLIAPDGPLHGLPFAALRGPDGRYLIEKKPVCVVASASVYVELRRGRRPPRNPAAWRVAVFGDPLYPQAAISSAIGAAAAGRAAEPTRGDRLPTLPASRREAEALRALFPHADLYLGAAATEERAKALDRGVDILHFAVHALLDTRLPLRSALALTPPDTATEGREDGLLEASEIIDEVRTDADLVTLSACNTALGQEMGAEGLVGLTRAFQCAGARSILAALWSIGDGPTASFMPRFYDHLRAGERKDEALRRTQVEWIRDPKRTRPYFWAPFELIGDYR
jgi:CHAT domain-containing protein